MRYIRSAMRIISDDIFPRFSGAFAASKASNPPAKQEMHANFNTVVKLDSLIIPSLRETGLTF